MSAAAIRHAVLVPADQVREFAGIERTGGQRQRQMGGIGNADVGAGQIVDHGVQHQRLARALRPRRDRQHHLVFVTDGFDAENRETDRTRPRNASVGEVARAGPVDARRKTRVAGGAPVDFPTIDELELKAELHGIGVAHRMAGADQPHRRVFGPGPVRSLGETADRRHAAEDHHQAEPCEDARDIAPLVCHAGVGCVEAGRFMYFSRCHGISGMSGA